MSVQTFLLIGCLIVSFSARAQGTPGNILYSWHGNSNYFQASFQIPPSENQPGQYFEDGTFKSTFSAISPDDIYPAAGGAFRGEDASGFGPPLQLAVTMTDPSSGKAVSVDSYNNFSFITEYRLSDSTIIWRETGSWSWRQVPEPSAGSLLMFAGLACFARHCSGAGLKRRTT